MSTQPLLPVIRGYVPRKLGSTNVVTLTFEHSNIPRLVFFLNEATLVQQYRKTNAVCVGSLDTARTCAPRPCRRPKGVRCAAKLYWTRRNHTSAIHAVRSVAGRTLPAFESARADIANQPPASPQASRLAKHATADGHHLVTAKDRKKASTQQATTPPNLLPSLDPRSGRRPDPNHSPGPGEPSQSRGTTNGTRRQQRRRRPSSRRVLRTPETDIGSTQRSSSTLQKQASIADMVDNALDEKFSAFTATITQKIEQSIFSHVSALEAGNTQQFHELTAPYITQME
ncbi:hypothetical protein MTO96_033766 [Rhipicephalus appendiculatus]